jgi:predicted AAA+ superfamily ATPase
MKRYLERCVAKDGQRKTIFLTGPRQTGKTTLAKLVLPNATYLNYDVADHRLIIETQTWPHTAESIIFDELHKKNAWKQFLKGLIDTAPRNTRYLVTGSAKLDVFRKVGDSMAGRFISYRVFPVDPKELSMTGFKGTPHQWLDRLLAVSGFPEPFLENDTRFYRQWRLGHLDVIVRQDLLDLTGISKILEVELLIELLRHRVGSPVSAHSLAQDLAVSPHTVRNWLEVLEGLYVIFRVTPYHKNVARAMQKEPKFYFYDPAYVPEENVGARLENLAALSLFKWLSFNEDYHGVKFDLHYLRNRNGVEIDFLVLKDRLPTHLIEVKSRDPHLSSGFKVFSGIFPNDIEKTQVVHGLTSPRQVPTGEHICDLATWLAEMPGIVEKV